MPINPSIIGNVMAPQAVQMPDVNAMLQTQTQGMENTYKIETARQQMAKEEAAAQQKAQEAATIKALLPAYTYGIQTGDIAGAGNLVPPKMRGNLQPFIDALANRSPEEVKSALIGSLAASPEGQEALAAIQRAETAGIQREQNKLSRDRLALDRQKQALDALGQGDWELKEGEGGFFWTNPRTRQVIPADVTGGAAAAAPGAAPGAIPAPDVVTPRQPAPGVPAAEAPISTAQPPGQQPQFRPKLKEGAEKGLNEGEGKSYNFAIRMIDSDAVANELEKEGVLTTDAVTDAVVGAIRALPTVAGGNLSEQIQNALNVVSPSLSPEEQRLAVAQLDFITAVLRSESGAEIKTSEFPAEYRKYFPVEGDENNPKLLADKKRRRQNAIEGMKTRAGKSGRAQIEAYFAGEGTAPPATEAPAAPGETFEGIKFLGVKEGP